MLFLYTVLWTGKVIIRNDRKDITVNEDHHPLNKLLKFYPIPVAILVCSRPDLKVWKQGRRGRDD